MGVIKDILDAKSIEQKRKLVHRIVADKEDKDRLMKGNTNGAGNNKKVFGLPSGKNRSGNAFYFEEGMTWNDWINSEYNTIPFIADKEYSTDKVVLYAIDNNEYELPFNIRNDNEEKVYYEDKITSIIYKVGFIG